MKKVLSIIMCMSLFIMWTLPVSAAEVISKENIIEKEDVSATSGSNSFSRTLSKLALMNGTATFSSGSISSNAQVTSISLYVRASSGSFPVIIYIQAPDGTTQSGTITFNDFSGCNPSGSWKIWFEAQETLATARHIFI